MTTGMESPQSSSITGYYKGFSVMVTKRDSEAQVKPLIDKAIEAIDYMLDKGFLPSWNTETSEKALGRVTISKPATPIATTAQSKPCPIHPDKVLYFNPNGAYGPFWSHKTDELNGNGKPVYCKGFNKKTATLQEYEKVQEVPDDINF